VTVYHLSAGGAKLTYKTTADPGFAPGGKVYVSLPAGKLKVFPK
jgi:hypothetical protein